jgi:hypothetical protein
MVRTGENYQLSSGSERVSVTLQLVFQELADLSNALQDHAIAVSRREKL